MNQSNRPAEAMTSQDFLLQRVSLRQLFIFNKVCEFGSLRKTAEHLSIAQPSISAILRDLETTVEAPLLERSPRGVQLTSYGELFAQHARSILAAAEYAWNDLRDLKYARRGSLSVGILPLASNQAFTSAVGQLRAERPFVKVALKDGLYRDVIEMLRKGDVSIAYGWIAPDLEADTIKCTVLEREEWLIFGRHDHPLLRHDNLDPESLARAAWVVPLRNSAIRPLVAECFNLLEIGFPDNSLECSSMLFSRSLLAQTDHLMLAPKGLFLADLASGLLVSKSFSGRASRLSVGYMQRTNHVLSPSERFFVECLTQPLG
ncbi:LysR substrate-binding domain-containing protein [Marinobacterium rhizophilum]|uniref:LysR family transcriptional regulator n=1 Tax=Marinobacterium rhizophilum TaxID=420402 RepID=A0ABY5HDU6_9GAMM|nr:LysR substrate-binding domain-containing protein [Marinobacterium rhizophilum]UTW10154.1 LysR family transcriptional regulator [Marinobacterium rhizophilum]